MAIVRRVVEWREAEQFDVRGSDAVDVKRTQLETEVNISGSAGEPGREATSLDKAIVSHHQA